MRTVFGRNVAREDVALRNRKHRIQYQLLGVVFIVVMEVFEPNLASWELS